MPESRRITDIREMGDDLKKADYAIEVRRYTLAIEIMQRVLSNQPDNSMAFYTMGRAYTLNKQPQQAREALRETLRLDASNAYAHALYGYLLQQQYHDFQAEEEMQTAIQLEPSNSYAHYTYANFLLDRNKNLARAREHNAKAMELDPADVNLHWQLGRINAAEGKIEEAEAAFRHGLSLDPENALIHNAYGALLYNHKRRPKEAFEHFRIALQQNPDDRGIRSNFVLALKAKNRFYRFGWHCKMIGKRLDRMPTFALTTIIGLVVFPFIIAMQIPILKPFVWVVVCLVGLLLFYMCMVELILDFLIKRGRLK